VRVVIDSSVVVAALATPNPESASRVVLAAVAAGVVHLVITKELEAEYRRAVDYPKVKRYAPKVDRQAFVDAVIAVALRVEAGSASGAVSADPGDDMVVAAAQAGQATVIVTLDHHLLDLAPPPRIRVLRPGELLRVLRETQ
jgi:putative PIN family toxin of toxin-antitoxin system